MSQPRVTQILEHVKGEGEFSLVTCGCALNFMLKGREFNDT